MLLSNQNVSNVSSADFASLISGLYENYKIVFDSVVSIESIDNAYLIVQLSDDNGVTYKDSGYMNYLGGGIVTGLACGLIYDGAGEAPYTVSGNVLLHNLLSDEAFVSHEGVVTVANITFPAVFGQQINGIYSGDPLEVNALRIVSSDGQNISGNFYLYGY